MLDQTFSKENLRKIYDIENRKGTYLDAKFFPAVDVVTQKLKQSAQDRRDLRQKKNSLTAEEYDLQYACLKEKEKKYREEKDRLLMVELERVSSEILSKNFSIELEEAAIDSPKPIYTFVQAASAYFALKQIQHNLRRLYRVKQSNRHHIINQLKMVLSDKFPKHLIRTDIKSFYETLPSSILLKKINDESLLSHNSRKIISSVVSQYKQLSEQETGIPRGIGISAYLAELYMRKIDSHITRDPDLLYYARYVDDIVIVYIDRKGINTSEKKSDIENEMTTLGLELNSDKTTVIDNVHDSVHSFDYLGYQFNICNGDVKLVLTDRKFNRLKLRIDKIFANYQASAEYYEKPARSLLVQQVRYLTGNTRLTNNKKNVVVGIYFSNSMLTNSNRLKGLDTYLVSKIAVLSNNRLKNRLAGYSFVRGFDERRFNKYSMNELRSIVKAWSDES